ncbi:MAG: BolA family protein [Rickettsiales bacterium]
MEERLKNKLTAAFSPLSLTVINDSAKHLGHAGHDGSGESHFQVKIVADTFQGKRRVERHRMVYDALKHELSGGIHALQVDARAPGE